MPRSTFALTALALTLCVVPSRPAQAQATSASQSAASQSAASPYPAMAPLAQYLMPDRASEIALARSAAPPSIANAAEVLVFGADGYTSAVSGSNGFVCVVERSWAKPTVDPEFWNPTMRAPTCFNPAAAQTFLPIFLMRTRLVLAKKSPSEILSATTTALEGKQLPALAPGAMCYMMSPRQYLSDTDRAWHPHLMFFVSGDAAKTWGANLPGSPVIAGPDPEEHATVFMVLAPAWSDGTPAPPS